MPQAKYTGHLADGLPHFSLAGSLDTAMATEPWNEYMLNFSRSRPLSELMPSHRVFLGAARF